MKRASRFPDAQARLRAALRARPAIDDADPRIQQIIAWLGNLMRLEGVPFEYLVPDPQLLPAESIRFFVVDDDWVTGLIDGAFSIGRSTAGIDEQDAALHAEGRAFARRGLHLKRRKRLDLASGEIGGDSSQVLSGFVLRSSALTIWPTMEVAGYRDAAMTEPATRVRFDLLAPTVALGLFVGELQAVTFAEPSETLHFGIDLPDAPEDKPTKTLRYADDLESGHPAGAPLLDGLGQPVRASVSMRAGGCNVLDVAGTAAAVQQALLDKAGMSHSTDYTTAQFALEMTEGVQQVLFTLTPPSDRTDRS